MSQKGADGAVTSTERSALEGRIGATNLRSAASVRDVAEATGLTEVEVMAHLRQIRAEAGFRPAAVERPSALPYIAGAALLTGLGVTWWRMQTREMEFPPGQAPQTHIAPTTVTTTISSRTETTPLVGEVVQTGVARPPSGFRVEVIGQKTDKLGDGLTGEIRAEPYEEVRDGLLYSAQALVEEVAAREGSEVAPAGTRYHGMEGGIFSPRPGFVRVAMFGWAGSEFAWIAVPLTEEGKAKMRQMAVTTLADEKKKQDDALRAVADYRQGVVSPPPGFTVQFAGRRLDTQSGPRVSFSDLPLAAVTTRMEAALLNAVYRDGRPPLGAWTGNAQQDAKIPRPSLSRVEATGPAGTVTADIPTKQGITNATKRAVHALAERLAKQMAKGGEQQT